VVKILYKEFKSVVLKLTSDLKKDSNKQLNEAKNQFKNWMRNLTARMRNSITWTKNFSKDTEIHLKKQNGKFRNEKINKSNTNSMEVLVSLSNHPLQLLMCTVPI
jgi:hypothetical protein